MEEHLIYIIKSAICLAAFYLPFRLWLREETFFRTNRYALLGMMILSFVLPLLRFPWFIQETTFNLPEIIITGKSENITEPHSTIHGATIIMYLYLLGSIYLFIKKICEWIRLKRFIPQGCIWIHKEEGIQIYCHAYPTASFSWMNQIIISEKDYQENGYTILLHEKGHIQCHHSWDMIWLSCVQILQWFNPIIWMISKDLQAIHEYEADQWMINQGEDRMAYQMLLIEKASATQPTFSLINQFHNSIIRSRIQMMNQSASCTWKQIKYIYLCPIVIILIWITSPKTRTLQEEHFEISLETFQFIGRHIKYPTSAIQKEIQGNVVVQMSLDKEGNIEALKVVEGIDSSLEAEALRITQKMPKWKTESNEITQYRIPFNFILDKSNNN